MELYHQVRLKETKKGRGRQNKKPLDFFNPTGPTILLFGCEHALFFKTREEGL